MLIVKTDADAEAVDMALAVDVENLPFKIARDLCQLPSTSAVYFLTLRGRILYIGATGNLKLRWRSHPRRSYLYKDSHVAWIDVPASMLAPVERAMIHEYQPPLNNIHTEPGRGMKGLSYKRDEKMQHLYRIQLECSSTERFWYRADMIRLREARRLDKYA